MHLVLEPGPMAHDLVAARHQPAQPLRRRVRRPDLRQVAGRMQARQDTRVDLVGPRPGMGNRLHLQRVGDHHPRHVAPRAATAPATPPCRCPSPRSPPRLYITLDTDPDIGDHPRATLASPRAMASPGSTGSARWPTRQLHHVMRHDPQRIITQYHCVDIVARATTVRRHGLQARRDPFAEASQTSSPTPARSPSRTRAAISRKSRLSRMCSGRSRGSGLSMTSVTRPGRGLITTIRVER